MVITVCLQKVSVVGKNILFEKEKGQYKKRKVMFLPTTPTIDEIKIEQTIAWASK